MGFGNSRGILLDRMGIRFEPAFLVINCEVRN